MGPLPRWRFGGRYDAGRGLGSCLRAGRAEYPTARFAFEQGVELAASQIGPVPPTVSSASDKLRHSPVVAYNLANAWVELGRLVEAAEVLRQIDKDPSAKPGVKKDARALLAQLEPRIATLVVEVESEPAPKDVRVNDRHLPAEAMGVPTPIDPGSVLVTVTDGGQVLWSKRVEVLPGGAERNVTITLPKQAVEPAPSCAYARETASARASRVHATTWYLKTTKIAPYTKSRGSGRAACRRCRRRVRSCAQAAAARTSRRT